MDQQEFAAALLRLSRHKIGVMEAAALFSIEGSISIAELSEKIKTDKVATRARLSVLRSKKLIISTYTPEGDVLHRRSKAGSNLVNSTLGQQ